MAAEITWSSSEGGGMSRYEDAADADLTISQPWLILLTAENGHAAILNPSKVVSIRFVPSRLEQVETKVGIR